MKKISITMVLLLGVMGIIMFVRPKEKILEENEINNHKSIAVYIEQEDKTYQASDVLPTKDSGYVFNKSKSACSNNATLSWDKETWSLKLSNLESNNTSCYLYFQHATREVETVLGTLTIQNEEPDFGKTSCSSGCGEATVGIYAAEDNDGESYYFRGDADNNWFYFAGYYWRIIRVNGNGSVRMIYNGLTTDQTGETTQIGTSAFNEKYDDNAYVGYMYGTPGSDTYEATHVNTNDSTIKTVVDNWYQTNLVSYSSYLDINSGFCNDRLPFTTTAGTTEGQGINNTVNYYAARIRLVTNKTPSMKCTLKNDLLEISVGLITADEISYAGGLFGISNSNFYLYTGNYYWTISPYRFNSGYVNVFLSDNSWSLNAGNVRGIYGVRPVINIRSDVTITGDGTISNPYAVEGV